MGEKAEIYAYTVIFSATEAFRDKTPYVAAIVARDGGEKTTALINGYQEGMAIHIGMPVVLDYRDAYGNPVYRFE